MMSQLEECEMLEKKSCDASNVPDTTHASHRDSEHMYKQHAANAPYYMKKIIQTVL